jgi:hypothetical protein
MDKIIEFFTLDPSDPIIFIAQIIGLLSLSGNLFTFAVRKRKNIFIAKIFCDFTASINLLMLGAVVGGAICGLNVLRSLIFYQRGRKKWASHVLVPIFSAALTIGCSLLDWGGLYSILPTVGSLFAIIGFWQDDPRLIKLLNLPCVTLWMIYNILSGSIGNSIANAISVLTILFSLTVAGIDYFKKAKATDSIAPKIQ